MTYQRTTGTQQRAERRHQRLRQLIFVSKPLMLTKDGLAIAPVTGRTMRYKQRTPPVLVTESHPPFVSYMEPPK